jgi:PAS domain S-box-containing protein
VPANSGAGSIPRTYHSEVPGTVLNNVPTLIVVLDVDARILRFNRACEVATGYSEAELLGRVIWDVLVPADEIDRVQPVFGSLRRDGEDCTFRNDWISRTGERLPIEWVNTVVRGEGGDVMLVLGTGTDLRRQLVIDAMADALRASQERYAGIVSIASDAIIAVDEAQRIVLFNEGAQDIFGWSAAEILGQPLETLIPERFRASHRARHFPAFASSPVQARRMGERREIFGLRRSGEEFPAEASISKLETGDGWLFTVVLRDVTATALLQARQRFLLEAGRVLASSLDYPTTLRHVAGLAVARIADFCIVDILGADGRIERLETAHRDAGQAELARQCWGIGVDEARPHLALEALRTRRSCLVEKLTPELTARFAQSAEHLVLLRRLGAESYMAVPLFARDQLFGAIVFVSCSRSYGKDDLAVAEELSRQAAFAVDHARLYSDALRAVRARDEVVSIVAHDLGNPISAIRIGTSLLLRAFTADGRDASIRQQLAAIRASTDQMEQLIANLLDLRRIEGGRLRLNFRSHSPAALLEGLRPMFELLATERGIALTVVVEDSTPTMIEADPDRLRQVLENLLGNAFKFTGPGGMVSLEVKAAEQEVIFTVRDSGPGITAEQIPHIFDRFWQAERSGRRSIGMGLAIAHGIVGAHGGRISVESEPGSGTVFSFAVPATGAPRVGPARGLFDLAGSTDC